MSGVRAAGEPLREAIRENDGTEVERSDALREIQAPIQDSLEAVLTMMMEAVSHDAPIIAQMGAHLMGMRGKMFRPTLVLHCANVTNSAKPEAVTLASAVELIHLATLVHDDAVDHSVLRRGMPTLNSLFSHQISVIMGDFLYSVALNRLVALGSLDALRALTRASTEMTVGEMRQLAVTDSLEFSEEDYYALIRSKTASLMGAACEVGALAGAAGYSEELLRYGTALGMAFQIADDLIDYTEEQATTGKPTGLDLREHKVTLPLIAALRVMSPAERTRVDEFFGKADPSGADVAEIVDIVSVNGGLEYARSRGQQWAADARGALAGLPETVARKALMDSISYVMERHA